MISAEVNKVVTCGDFLFPALLPHFRQFNIFGGKTPGFTHHTRETPALHFLASATESGVESGAFSFLPKNGMTPDAVNTQGQVVSLYRRLTVRDCTYPLGNGQVDHSPESNSDSLTLQIITTQTSIEQIKASIIDAMEELAELMKRLVTLEQEADPFRAFISGLDMGEL